MLLDFLLAGSSGVVLPEVLVPDRGRIFHDDILDNLPVVDETAH
jgi:hypothetical protein